MLHWEQRFVTTDIRINTLASGTTLTEQYFAAKTKRGICAVNYQPDVDKYVGGPFLTWDGAHAHIDVYCKHRRTRQLLTVFSAAAALTLLSSLIVIDG